MREIVSVQVGQCGNQIGTKFWQTITEEHGVEEDGSLQAHPLFQLEKIDVYFREQAKGRVVPRCILTDLEPGPVSQVIMGKSGRLFRPQNCVSGLCGAGNTWAKGYYQQGSQIIDQVMDSIRKQTQQCQSMQGFQLSHSIGGGTGSGMGSLLVSKLKEEYTDKLIQSFCVFPSSKVSDCVVEPYNATLSINHLIENADGVIVLDNEALYNIATRVQKLQTPTYADINHLISNSMAAITSTTRFPSGMLNSDLRKTYTNLMPFPRLHFLFTSCAPLTTRYDELESNLKIQQVTQQVFDPKSSMCDVDWRHGRFLTAALVYRGPTVTGKQTEHMRLHIGNRSSSPFVEWIPYNLKTTHCATPAKNANLSGVMIGNSTAIMGVFKRIGEYFSAMFKKKAFLKPYTFYAAMDEMEFVQAESNLNDLVSEYQQYQDATCEEESELDDDQDC